MLLNKRIEINKFISEKQDTIKATQRELQKHERILVELQKDLEDINKYLSDRVEE